MAMRESAGSPFAFEHRSALAEDEYFVECEDLFKIYKLAGLEVVALRGLDLKVRRGELMAIVGASGSGKSTMLNILAGLDQPSAGRAWVGGRDLLTMSSRELVDYRRREVGFVWQQTGRNLVEYLDVQQNVELPLILSGSPPAKARARASELIETVGLTPRARHRPGQLSGGEQQRVAIAIALANDPPLLLADEPTGELDSIAAGQIFQLFGELNRRHGVTVIIVTHSPAIAESVDRVVAIRDGRTSSEIIRRVQSDGNVLRVMHDEFVLVDGAGRLQIPGEYLHELDIQERARVQMGEGRVEVLPGRRPGERRP